MFKYKKCKIKIFSFKRIYKMISISFCRQVTDYDQTCLELDDNGVPLGSRVFGDCDKMMRELMRCVLPGDELKKWEQDREVRMLAYDTQRKL